MTTLESQTDAVTWDQANHLYLRGEMERLRLLLKRRVLWLRKQWARDTGPSFQGMAISDVQADRLLAGEDRGEEERFYQTDPEAAKLSRSIREMENATLQRARTMEVAGQPPAIDLLVRSFDLSPFERDLLLLCLAPDLDQSFELLYAYIQDDVTRKYPTLHLALSLFADQEAAWLAARHRLTADATIYRLRLINMEPGAGSITSLLSWPLRLSPRAADYLLGVNRPEDRITELLRPMPPALLTREMSDLAERLHHWIDDTGRGGAWPAVNLIGPPRAGKRALARALCDRMGLQLFGLDVVRLPATDPERYQVLRLLEREAVLSHLALYIDTGGLDASQDAGTRAAFAGVVERLGVFLFVGSTEHWQTERAMIGVHVPKPDASAQSILWRQALSGTQHTLNGHLEGLVQQFDFGPASISEAVATARAQASFRTLGEVADLTAEELWQACLDQAGWRLDELAHRIVPCHTWQDIILPQDVNRQLREIAAQVQDRAQVYETWGFGAKLSRGRGISALFAGPSGTGKTLAAEVLAYHLNLHLYRIDLSGVVSKYIGETEKNLRRVFDAAEQSGAILFFDEADALFGKRSEVKDSHDRYANIEINYLLQRMEDYRGLAILATNMKSHIDPAFLRRLRFLVDLPFPDAAYRAQIWRRVLPESALTENLDYDRLARLEVSGGNIKNIMINAAFLAAAEGQAIGMKHVLHAARREYLKIEKLVLESDFGPFTDNPSHERAVGKH